MGKKKMMKKFPFLSKTSERWRPWPSCAMSGDLKTHSFRGDGDGIFKILNSAYNLDSAGDSSSVFSGKVEACSSTASFEQLGSDSVEKVIRGLRSERLVFTPEETSSMAGAGAGEKFPFKESVAMEMDSTDPITDFKRSMEEMVEAHDGLKDWEFLEGLLICYLRINGKSTHGYIVGAFVDLLVGLSIDAAAAAAATTVASSSSSDNEHCLLSSSSTIDHNSFTSQFSFTSSATCSTGPYFSLQEKSHEDEIMEKSSMDHASSSSPSSSHET